MDFDPRDHADSRGRDDVDIYNDRWLDDPRDQDDRERDRERELERLMDPVQRTPRKEAPTLRAFAPRFMDGHARANRQKPSGIASKEMILRVHLLPAFGHTRLDAIKSEDVQRLKRNLEAKSPKTVNNILAVLSVLLKKGVEWEVIERCRAR